MTERLSRRRIPRPAHVGAATDEPAHPERLAHPFTSAR